MNEYTVISIDDSRNDKKNWIKQRFIRWSFADIEFVNGKNPEDLRKAKNKWSNIAVPGPFKAGEFGVFYSVLNCLEYGAQHDGILYFEDDAIPVADFEYRLECYIENLPAKADLFACWSPENQHGDYKQVSGFNSVGEPSYQPHTKNIFDIGHEEICKLWQGYGNVSMYFTKAGCIKLLSYIENKGFFSPIDCLICIAAHTDSINGYSLKPGVKKLIDYDWKAPTTIHHSRWGMIEELI